MIPRFLSARMFQPTQIALGIVLGSLSYSAYALDPIDPNYTDNSQVDVTSYQYAAPGVLYTMTYPDGRIKGYSNLSFANLPQSIQDSSATNSISRGGVYQYNADRELTLVAPYDGGNLSGSVTRYSYNAFGERISENAPEIGTHKMAYDAQGNLISLQDSKGNTIQISYDALNRPVQKTVTAPDGTIADTFTYTYDSTKGYPTRVQNNTATLSWTWAPTGELTSLTETIDNLTFMTTWNYDSTGRVIQQTLPSGNQLNFEYDPTTQRLSTVTLENPATQQSQIIAQSLRYLPFGGVQGWTWGNGSTHLEELDMSGKPLQIMDRYAEQLQYSSGQQINQRSDLNPSSQLSPVGSGNQYAYNYDGVNRLIQFSLNNGTTTTTQDFSWDKYDNRLDPGTVINQRDPNNAYQHYFFQQWIQENGQTATYDANGNLIGLGTRSYGYNALNQLTDVSDGGVIDGQYNYGPNGFRVKKTANGKTLYFMYLPNGELLGEYEAISGGYHVDREHIYLNHAPIAVLSDDINSDVLPQSSGIAPSATTAQKIARLQTRLSDVQAKATAKETDLQQKIDTEKATAAQEVTDLQQQINALLADASQQEVAIQSDISTLLSGAATQTAELQSELAAAQTDKAKAKIQKELDKLATQTADQQAKLQDKLNGVVTKTADKQTKLQDKITQTETNATQKEQELQAKLDAATAKYAERIKTIQDKITSLEGQGSGGSGSSVAQMVLNYVHTDVLGTPRKITRASDNALMWSLAPDDPWGNNQPDVTSTLTYNLRFAGQYYDTETGLHENRNRFYDPKTGRYLQPDPIGLAGGLHRYLYVNGDPINKKDPSGLTSVPCPAGLPAGTTCDNGYNNQNAQPTCATAECAAGLPPLDLPSWNPKFQITTSGACSNSSDPLCVASMQAAGIPGPYYGSTKTYSTKCVVSFGAIKPFGIRASNAIASNASSLMSKWISPAVGDSFITAWAHPVTTTVFTGMAINEVLEKCECEGN